jgi:hypothetical protein
MPSMTQFLFSGSGFGCMLFGEYCFAQCFGCRMGLISYMSFYFIFSSSFAFACATGGSRTIGMDRYPRSCMGVAGACAANTGDTAADARVIFSDPTPRLH